MGKKNKENLIPALLNVLVHLLPHFQKQALVWFEVGLSIFMYDFILGVFLLSSLVFFHTASWSSSVTALVAKETPSRGVPAVGAASIPAEGRAVDGSCCAIESACSGRAAAVLLGPRQAVSDWTSFPRAFCYSQPKAFCSKIGNIEQHWSPSNEYF